MHLPDIIELAKECKSRLSAEGETHVAVHDDGTMSVFFWYSPYERPVGSLRGFEVDLPAPRTPEDVLEMVDAYVAKKKALKATAADFGITEDGRPLTHAAE